MRKASRVVRFAVPVVLVLLLAPASGSPATGKTLLFQPRHSGVGGIVPTRSAATPEVSGNGDLTYHGGAVMRTNKTYAIYWLPSGYSYNGNNAGYEGMFDRYFTDVAHDSGLHTNLYTAATQYYDTIGGGTHHIAYDSTFAGSTVATNAFPSTGQCTDAVSFTSVCLKDSQLQAEIQNVVTANGWPQNGSSLYFIFTPPSVGSCFDDGSGCAYTDYCAYHGSFITSSGEILYANQPWLSGVNGCDEGQYPNASDADPVINVVSHEHNEAITDPNVNQPDNAHIPAWYDGAGYENGDKCAWTFGGVSGPSGAEYSETINGHHYFMQEEYNNAGHNCIQQLASPGVQLWGTRYATSGDDHANADAFSPDGSTLYVTGASSGGMLTNAYRASNGATLWSRNFTTGTNEGRSVAVSPDGSKVFVTGQSLTSGHYDYVTIAYDAATGNRLWLQRFNSTANLDDIPAAVTVSPDGSKVFVTGSSVGASTGKDYATLAYNATTGAQLWVMRFNGAANGDDGASAIGVNSDGSRVFVTGTSAGAGTGQDYATVGYDASSGTRLWATRYNGPVNGTDSASALGVSPDGSKVFVTGESQNAVGYQPATVAYDASSGAALWSNRYGGAVASGGNLPALAVSPDGSRVYVAGAVAGGSSLDYGTVAYSTSVGSQLWSATYNGPSGLDDAATSIAASPDGSKIFVTGWSGSASTGKDYATLAYDATTGTWRWTRRNNGPGNGDDVAKAVAVSAESERVAVAGSSPGSGTGLDQATIVYESN